MLNTGFTFTKAFSAGVIPFIPGDIIKVFLAAYLTAKIPIDKI